MKKLISILFLSTALIASVFITTGQQRNSATAAAANSADWPTFGGDNTRTNANMAPTRITAANLGTMVRQQVSISAPIDAGLIYLRGIQVNGAAHDTFFGTTNLGRTVAIEGSLKDLALELGLTHEALYRALAELVEAGEIKRSKKEIRWI